MASAFGGLGAGVIAGGGGGSSGEVGRRNSEAMRAINIIQHQDAGPNNGEEKNRLRLFELPPAYTW